MSLQLPGALARVGPYRVLRTIARGGHAEVYEVYDPVTGEHLALKWLVALQAPSQARFLREYAVLNSLDHPRVARVMRFGIQQNVPWILMEMLEGSPLQAYARDAGRPGEERRISEVLRLAAELCDALDHLHQRGVVHRDLKSANVLVRADGHLKLLDFGAARYVDGRDAITGPGEFLGTFAYAAPEQLQGWATDARSDLYSLGVLLFRMLTGRRPFEERDPQILARQHLYEAPPAPSALVPQLSPAIDALVAALLAKRADDRPGSAAEVRAALAALGAPSAPPPARRVGPEALLVGREAQLVAARSFFEVWEPGDALALVGGAGSGRAAVREALREAAEAGAHRAWTVDAGAPDAWDALRRAFGPAWPAERGPHLAWGERLAELLSDLADEHRRPVALFVFDFHLASRELATALAEARAALRAEAVNAVLVVDVHAEDPEAEARALGPLGALERVVLPPLDVPQTAALVGALRYAPPAPHRVAEPIWRASGGRPEWVVALVDSLPAGPAWGDPDPRAWRPPVGDDGRPCAPTPPEVERWVLAGLQSLPVDDRRVLEALALLDGAASTEALAVLLERPPAAVASSLRSLAARGWVLDEGARVILPLAAARSALEAELRPARRAALERRLLASAGVLDGAARVRALVRHHRHGEAAALASELAAQALSLGRPRQALRVLVPVCGSEGGAAPATEAAAVACLGFAEACLALGPSEPGAREALKAAVSSVVGGPAEGRARLLRARVSRTLGDERAYREGLAEVWTRWGASGDASLAAQAAELLAFSTRDDGDPRAEREWNERARRAAERLPDARARLSVRVGACFERLDSGDHEAVAGDARRWLAEARQLGAPRTASLALAAWVEAERWRGRVSEALQRGWPSAHALRSGGAPTWHARATLALAGCELSLGRIGRSRMVVESLVRALDLPAAGALGLEIEALAIRIELDAGQHVAARARALSLREKAEARGFGRWARVADALAAEALARLQPHGDRLAAFDATIEALITLGAFGPAFEAAFARCTLPAPPASLAPERAWPQAASLPVVAWHRAIAAVARGEGSLDDEARALEVYAACCTPEDAAGLRAHFRRPARPLLSLALGPPGSPPT